MAGNGRKTAIYHSLSFPNSLYFEKKVCETKLSIYNFIFTSKLPKSQNLFYEKRSPLDFFKETLILGAFFRSMAQLWVDINGFWYYRPTK